MKFKDSEKPEVQNAESSALEEIRVQNGSKSLDSEITLDTIKKISIDCQWHLIAEILDRCFLIIFIVLTIFVFGMYLLIGFALQMDDSV